MDSAVVHSSAAKNSPVPPGFSTSKNLIQLNLTKEQERRLRHRSLFAFRFMVGRLAHILCVDHSHYIGIFDCINPDDFSIVLKNTQQKTQIESPTFQNGRTMVFKRDQVAQISIEGGIEYSEFSGSTVTLKPKTAELITDGEITGDAKEKQLFGRELQAASSWLDPTLDTGELEDTINRRNSHNATWNQFEANEKLFGVVSSFDENIYTTKLDRDRIPSEQLSAAERIAREIERQSSSNSHLQEERGRMSKSMEDDEEARYSSVDRNASKGNSDRQNVRDPNVYVPPALRNNDKSRQQKSSPNLPKSDGNDKETTRQPTEQTSSDAEIPATNSPQKTDTDPSTKDKEIATVSDSSDSNGPIMKKRLNPNAREFKWNPSASTFSPKYPSTPSLPVSHPGNVRYTSPRMDPRPVYPPQDEWMYDKGAMLDENDMMSQPFLGYGVPLPPVMMQPPVYPMMPQHPNSMNGQRPFDSYGFPPPNYNHPFYPEAPPAPMSYGPRPQPPLPREPKKESANMPPVIAR
uniref:Uncharacterized protein AlNc14C272G9977 n=1 Tax=Albugo laibachii Nc14 TaxID=890382 RepID=F0WUG4_9STRA|nr:conserved hypothetical protein [Albugo laibachii Nc14]|eukprot:CCA25044.1 conserved hypothetical protein [Albugo laibachii Nc14]